MKDSGFNPTNNRTFQLQFKAQTELRQEAQGYFRCAMPREEKNWPRWAELLGLN